MYPSGVLTELAQRKTVLRARISLDRERYVQLAGEVTKPLDWLDRAITLWRKIPLATKLAALPLAVLLHRNVLPGKKISFVRRAIRFMPVVVNAVKLFKARRRNRTAHMTQPV